MCLFMFVITSDEIDSKTIKAAEEGRLYIRDDTDMVRDKIDDTYYYDLNNGHCACDIAASPFDKADTVKEVFQSIHSGGSFRFMITDAYEDEIEEYVEDNNKFEKKLKDSVIHNISFREFLKIYPDNIEIDKVYRVR